MSRFFHDSHDDLNTQDQYGNTTLMRCCMGKCYTSFQAIMAAGPELDVQNSYGRTALILSICYKNTEMAKALIAAGANIHLTAVHGNALDYARANNNPCIERLLLQKGAMSYLTL